MATANERQQEPSMEEILASIRRIISEDGEEGDAKASAAKSEDVLELTEVVPEEGGGEVVNLNDQKRKAEKADKPAVAEPAPAVKAKEEPKPAPQTASQPGAKEATKPMAAAQTATATGDGGLMSAEREAVAAAAMGGLLQAVKDEPLVAGGRTVEEIARELLRPMLRSWLDENLPVLVERLVKEEIERVVGRARGR